ncbi:MAG: prepilin-type N-terminal cleavage/methylation domain-containing protein [Halobacteriovoraceae bacterium]|nr:prepilin-type N-terminal cleavage/methylation domain-containing protein [Halobacteriovoraceae bacterium]
MKNGKKTASEGFTLLEVLIALFIFAVFMASFVTSQGYSLNSSLRMRETIKLKELCQTKLNEIILTPPNYTESLTLTNEVSTFEDQSNYEFEIEYRRLEIPDPAKLNEEQQNEQESPLESKVTTRVINIMKEVIWQVIVTVRNKETKESFDASAWLINNKAKINVSAI